MRSEQLEAAPTAGRRGAWLPVLVLVLIWFAPKLLVLSAPRADLLGEREAMPYDMHGEEYARGDIAVEIMEGPLMPVLDYQWTPFFGGSLVVGLLAIPSFLVFGANVFALKLVPLCFGALMVASVFLLVDRGARGALGGRRAAWCAGLLAACAPPGYTAISTIAWGVHVALNGLIVLCLFLFARIWTAGERARGWDFALLGAACGFSIYFGYAALIATATIGLFLLLRERRLLVTPSFPALLGGFALGFAPWLVFNLRHDFRGLAVYGTSLTEHASIGAKLTALPGRLLAVATEHLPFQLFFRDLGFVPGAALTWTVGVVLAGLVLLGVARLAPDFAGLVRAALSGCVEPERTSALALVPVYLVLMLLAYTLTDFFPEELPDIITLRYAMLLWPPLVVLAGLGVEGLLRGAEPWPKLGWIACGLVCALATAGTLGLVDLDRRGTFWNDPAYKHPGHGRWLVLNYATEPEVVVGAARAASERRSPEWQAELYLGMGRALKYMTSPTAKLEEPDRTLAAEGVYTELLERLLEVVPERYRASFPPAEE